jgi:hypothetical protein
MQHVPCCNTLEGASEEWQNWPATTCTYHPRRRGNCPRQRRPHRSCVCRGHRPTSLPEPPQSRRARRPDPHTAEDNPFFPACLSVCHRVRQLALLHCYSLEPITAQYGSNIALAGCGTTARVLTRRDAGSGGTDLRFSQHCPPTVGLELSPPILFPLRE